MQTLYLAFFWATMLLVVVQCARGALIGLRKGGEPTRDSGDGDAVLRAEV